MNPHGFDFFDFGLHKNGPRDNETGIRSAASMAKSGFNKQILAHFLPGAATTDGSKIGANLAAVHNFHVESIE